MLVSTMLGLRAWGDDLVVVLFEFLEDDTKLAQSCTDWLYEQHWYTVVPDPDALGAGGSRRELSRALARHTVPLFCFPVEKELHKRDDSALLPRRETGFAAVYASSE